MIAKSPAHFKAGYSGIDVNVARIGSAIHSAVLEDNLDVLVAPDFGNRIKKNAPKYEEWFVEQGASTGITELPATEWWTEFERRSGKYIVTEKEKSEIEAAVQSVRMNSLASELLKSGKAEQSIFASYMDIDVKCRPDFITDDGKILVDLKSTRSAARHHFRSSCATYRYHVQHAFYSAVYYEATGTYPDFYFIALEKTKPFSCAVYKLDDNAVQNGIYLMERDIETYKKCMKDNFWPGLENDLELDIPIYEQEEILLSFEGQDLHYAD